MINLGVKVVFLTFLSLVWGLVIPNAQSRLNFDENVVSWGEEEKLLGWAEESIAPIMNRLGKQKIIPHKYVIIFNPGVREKDIDCHKEWIIEQLKHISETAEDAKDGGLRAALVKMQKEPIFFRISDKVSGYSGFFTEEVVKMIQRSEVVRFIEEDVMFHVSEKARQAEAPWGLSRVCHRGRESSQEYLYDDDAGKGVTAYVIDTGIKVEHEEFEGRAKWGATVALPKLKVDGHGHGTHCAGIIGSKSYGIAKKVDLVAVSVMNFLGSGSTSDILKGLEFAVNDHKANIKHKKKGFKGSVINMSIGGGVLEALDLAVNSAIKAGLHVAVAAGNDNQDACSYSPARAIGPITVGAVNAKDEKASFSNYGSCVDIFAPGEDILSTFTWSKSAMMSGTSQATPHVTGLLAYFLSLYPEVDSDYATDFDPLLLKSKFLKYATSNVLKGLDAASPNLLPFNGAGSSLKDFFGL